MAWNLHFTRLWRCCCWFGDDTRKAHWTKGHMTNPITPCRTTKTTNFRTEGNQPPFKRWLESLGFKKNFYWEWFKLCLNCHPEGGKFGPITMLMCFPAGSLPFFLKIFYSEGSKVRFWNPLASFSIKKYQCWTWVVSKF